MICNECGSALKSGVKFCNTCGASTRTSQTFPESRGAAQQPTGTVITPPPDNRMPPAGSSYQPAAQQVRGCLFHPQVVAIGVCMSCSNFFCQSCLFSSGGRNYCQGCWARHSSAPLNVQPYYQPAPVPVQQVQYVQYVQKQKEPGIALLLSFFMPGVGQIYNGQVGKGILFLIGFWILVWFVIGIGIWIWAMIDAYQTATRINQGLRV